ncbi:MAG: hypothetical protein AB7O24_28385 [Kofleriaceae bacterium]
MGNKHTLHRFCGANLDTRCSLKRVRPLAEVLKYRNPAVIDKFLESYAMPRRDADALFTELKRWLWLNARAHVIPGSPNIYVIADMTAIDEMWHTFLLFTKDYQDFCDRYFGHFVHHVPNTDRAMQRDERNERRRPELVQQNWEASIRFICEQLGERIALRWFKDYPKRFSLAKLDRRRRSHRAIIAAAG